MAFQQSENVLEPLKEIVKEARKKADQVDHEGAWPSEDIKLIQSSGLGGLLISKELGGLGEGFLTMVKACEMLGSSCASTSMCYGMHLVGTAVIAAKATDFHKEEFLKPIAQGRHWTTLSLSEPGTGSHFYIPQTEMTVDKDTVQLNGKKSFVTNGGHADSYVISTVTPEGPALGEFSCIVVPGQSKGLDWGPQWDGIGMRGNSSRSLELHNVQVSKDHLLGLIGDQIWYVFEVVAPNFLLAMSGTYLGIAQAAINEAVEHLKKRHMAHTGDPLSGITVLQHRLGGIWGQLEKTRQLIYSAAVSMDKGDPDAVLAVMSAKAEVADTAVHVVNECMTLMGGQGYNHSSAMERHLRDVRAAHVMSPTTDILKTWIGRALLDLPLLGD